MGNSIGHVLKLSESEGQTRVSVNPARAGNLRQEVLGNGFQGASASYGQSPASSGNNLDSIADNYRAVAHNVLWMEVRSKCVLGSGNAAGPFKPTPSLFGPVKLREQG